MADARQVGARVEELLGILQSEGGEATASAAEELVRLLLGLYGDGLSHIMAALQAEGAAGTAILDRLLEDPLVESLLHAARPAPAGRGHPDPARSGQGAPLPRLARGRGDLPRGDGGGGGAAPPGGQL